MDILSLLAPIQAQLPCGEDYCFSNEFHAIKLARTQDDTLLEQGDWVTAPKQADWDFVANTVIHLLQTKTKDIRLLTWLAEAWANLSGFEGISKSLELSHRLIAQYWITLHPEIEDEDLDQRIGLLQGQINQLPVLIKKVPLVNQAPFYCLLDYDNFLYQENMLRKQGDDSSVDHSAELAHLEQAVLELNPDIQRQNYQYFTEILQHWTTLKQVLDHELGLDAPSFAAIDSSFNSIHLSLKKIYKVASLEQSPVTALTEVTALSPSISPPVSIQSSTAQQLSFQPQQQSHLENREHAMQVLQEISAYFQKNEPHSPVSYLLEKTIKWSQMPLHEWLAQVIKDEHPLNMLQDTLGVQSNNQYQSE